MFAHADKYAAARIVEANCGTNYWRRHDRHLSLDALEGTITKDHPDEWMIVKLEDAALITGINHHYLLDDYASTVRKDIREAFGELYCPGLRWIDKFKRGHQTLALLVLEKYLRNPRMIYAIRSLLEEQHPTEARLNCPRPNNNQYRAKAHKALMKAYGCFA